MPENDNIHAGFGGMKTTEIHEFVPRDATRRQEADAGADTPVENLNLLIRRVAIVSMEEIDQVIAELHRVRGMLRSESECLSRDIVRYASLNQQLLAGMKVVAESLKQWKGAPMSREQALADFKARWLGGDVHDDRIT
jgi:hypothetical protein